MKFLKLGNFILILHVFFFFFSPEPCEANAVNYRHIYNSTWKIPKFKLAS